MRILLADDQPQVRFALRVLLERQPGVDGVAEAIDAGELLQQIRATCPDLVLLAWGLPGMAMPDLISALHGTCPHLAVIALSGRPEARNPALEAGADGFVSKADPPEHLLAAVHACCGGDGRGAMGDQALSALETR